MIRSANGKSISMYTPRCPAAHLSWRCIAPSYYHHGTLQPPQLLDHPPGRRVGSLPLDDWTIALHEFVMGVQDPPAHSRELPATSTNTKKPRSSPHHLLGGTMYLLVDQMPTTLAHQCSCNCPCFDNLFKSIFVGKHWSPSFP
jgi:hypothetical protein